MVRAAKKSGSERSTPREVEEVVSRLKRDAAPAVAKALNLDSAEAVEAALNASVELFLAARSVVRAMPLPAEARAHLDLAEAESLRAARMAMRGVSGSALRGRSGPAREVRVDFAGAQRAKGKPAAAPKARAAKKPRRKR